MLKVRDPDRDIKVTTAVSPLDAVRPMEAMLNARNPDREKKTDEVLMSIVVTGPARGGQV